MPIFVSMSFKLVFFSQMKEIIRMGKGRVALQSRFNDFHTNPCIFLSFQFILAYLTLGKNRNLSPVFGA